MELKCAFALIQRLENPCSNRTFMELKLMKS